MRLVYTVKYHEVLPDTFGLEPYKKHDPSIAHRLFHQILISYPFSLCWHSYSDEEFPISYFPPLTIADVEQAVAGATYPKDNYTSSSSFVSTSSTVRSSEIARRLSGFGRRLEFAMAQKEVVKKWNAEI